MAPFYRKDVDKTGNMWLFWKIKNLLIVGITTVSTTKLRNTPIDSAEFSSEQLSSAQRSISSAQAV